MYFLISRDASNIVLTRSLNLACTYPDPSPSLPLPPPTPLPPHLILMVTRRTTVMRMMPQPMPPMMLRNGSMSSMLSCASVGGPAAPAAAWFEDGESSVDCFSGNVAAPRGFNSPSTVCSVGRE